MDAQRIAVTVVSGFLGAGKTTLLNRMVRRAEGSRLAVIVNDFGELNIDAAIVAEVTDAVVSLQNGCICCTVQEDLLAQLASMAQLQPRLERIVIECSGVSDPQRIVQTLAYPQLRNQMHLDMVITVVDATGHLQLEGEYARLARAQVAAADLLLLNKTDLVDEPQLQALRDALGQRTRIHESVQGYLPDALWLDGDLDLEPRAVKPLTRVSNDDHSEMFSSYLWQGTTPLNVERLRGWLQALPREVFRVKGLVVLDQGAQAHWLQHVGTRSQFSAATDEAQATGTRLVFIAARGFNGWEALARGLVHCQVVEDKRA
ncbi:GTPase, G3E family [Pseudomonas sp. ok272]|uniref:CobW family GTP-binding protein n=1 Tax=unclassified Pseudomonas TaxID=196821 RepID=UPI0008CF707B|nr:MULTISPECIES: GTP-binding protein [unclassified Pseudomonas]SEN31852.1 GTPase, G3E family [Pseudomonas sp. ok272]SFN18952.1 GTPase, G3E family [Pseudomonas sp. ok602]